MHLFKKPKTVAFIAVLFVGLIFLVIIMVVMKKEVSKAPQKREQLAQISITKNGFEPASIVVKKGTKIRWTNNDDATHQVAANPHPTGKSLPKLKSEVLNNNQNYVYTADKTGTFGYHDQLNPTVNGTLEVRN